MKGQMMDYALTTNSIIEYGNRVFPHKEIVSKLPDGTWHRYSYAEMYKRTKRLASALVNKLNVKTGDRIGTFAWNHYQHLELYYGIPGAGAICHTLNIRLSASQIAYIINHAEDKVIFIDASLVPLFEKIIIPTPSVQHFILLNAPPGFDSILPNIIHYEELIENVPETFQWVSQDEHAACGLCYTSGTTGDPKGVLYSHRSTYLHAMGIMQPNAFNISSRDKALLIVPQFHVMAWGFPYVCMMAGADMVFPSSHLQPQALINISQQEKVTLANGVPSIWMGIYDELRVNPPSEKLTLREFLVGGSAISQGLLEGMEKDFGIPGVHAWGMTETSPLGTVCRLNKKHDHLPDEERLNIQAKQGIEIIGVELRTVAENGSVCARDGKSVGEFEIRGPWIVSKYYKATGDEDSSFNNGWFKTGDVGIIDEDGYMQITDRKKDLIKSGGEWISSIDLELTLMAHPGIKEACVIAVPDERWGERPVACIVFEKETVSADELKRFLGNHFSSYQLPDQFIPMPEIPKTSVGKMDKKELRRLYPSITNKRHES